MIKLATAVVLVLVVFQAGQAISTQLPPTCGGGMMFDSARTRPPSAYETPDLYFLNRDGTEKRRLTLAKPGEFSRTPSVSPDRQRVAFHGNRDGQAPGVYVMTCADGSVAQATSPEGAPAPIE